MAANDAQNSSARNGSRVMPTAARSLTTTLSFRCPVSTALIRMTWLFNGLQNKLASNPEAEFSEVVTYSYAGAPVVEEERCLDGEFS